MSTEGYGDKYVQSNQIREREDISKIIETDGNSPDHVVLIGTIPLTPSELKDHNFVNNDLLNGASGPTKTKPNHRFFVRNHVYGVLGVTCNIRGDIMVKLWNPWGLKKDLKLQEILPHIRSAPVPVPNPTFGPGPLPIFPLVLPGCLLPPPACLIVACGLGVCPDVPYPEGMIAAGCILPAPACNISCEDEEQKKCYADEEYATANVSSTVPLSTFVEASTTPIAATEEPMTTPTEAPAVPSTQPSAVPDNGNGDDDNGGVIPVLPPPGDDLDVPNTGMGNGETTQTTSATGPASTDALTTNPTVPSSATEAAVATAAMETPTTVSAFETLVTASAMETPVTSSPLEEPGSISPMEVPSTITDPSAPDDELQPFKTFTFSDAPEPTDSPSNTSDPAVSDNAPAPNISSDSSTILASVDSTGTNEATETDTFPSSITATMSGDEEGDMSATSSSTARADPSENAVASAASDLVPINTLGTPRNGTISSITISTSNQVGPALAGNDSESATSSAGNIFVEPVSSGSRNTSIASATSSSTRPVVSSAATGATTSSSAALDSSTTSTGAVTSGAPTSNSGIPEASTTSTGASPSKSHRQCVRKADKRRIA
ncbi:hypothetical protein CcaverHIS631_0404320 [Cutaneotrichosporon cavernicola]|nr:hypothetical protein CcaverHIS631_0404320 [Cutaneotrichosporon cavernicola]